MLRYARWDQYCLFVTRRCRVGDWQIARAEDNTARQSRFLDLRKVNDQA
jgi:hypothetical protein